MLPQSSAVGITSIHPGAHVGKVVLRVADLERSIHFYEEVLGFHSRLEGKSSAALSPDGDAPILILNEQPGVQPMPRSAAGLYHFAILVPSRPDLGIALKRLYDAGIHIGQADHGVSEALYLADPDNNGIEIYRDRPRTEWRWINHTVQMGIDPLDLDGLMSEGRRKAHSSNGLPGGTRLGHIHLQVSETEQAVEFYHGLLGFEITAWMPGAVFMSAGGYHHHIGANIWNTRGAKPAASGTAGLEAFTIEVPDRAEVDRLAVRLAENQVAFQQMEGRLEFKDSWQIQVIIEREESK